MAVRKLVSWVEVYFKPFEFVRNFKSRNRDRAPEVSGGGHGVTLSSMPRNYPKEFVVCRHR